jgi:hypothetical protein
MLTVTNVAELKVDRVERIGGNIVKISHVTLGVIMHDRRHSGTTSYEGFHEMAADEPGCPRD